jgi:glycosyltransferase involved in cell wall biosynthesis
MHLVFLTPSPDPAGGGSRFNAGLLPALRALGHTADMQHDADDLPPGARPIVDGLLLPDLEGRLVPHHAVAIIHHMSAKAGQDKSAKEAVRASEQRMLPGFARVIATSKPVADRLHDGYGLDGVALLPPGQPDLPRSPGSGGPGCHVLSAGVLTQRKGHDRLLRALAPLTDLDWTLTIAGDAQRDPAHAQSVVALVDDLQLQSRVTILPDVTPDALEAEWARADLFALASSWEGYPAGAAEALRRGIPVAATTVGELPATVPMTAGILFPPDDPATMSKCLRRAIFDTSLRASLAEGAWQAGLAMPGWPQQALAFLSIIQETAIEG